MKDNPKNNPQDALTKIQRSPKGMAGWQQAKQYLNTGRSDLALAGYRDLVQHFPDVPLLWAELGLAAAGDLEFALADQAYQRALELAPADASLLVFISGQYYSLRRMDQVLACLKRAVEAEPSSANVRLALGAWLERSRRLDEAWECAETCLKQNSKDAQALFFKAFLLHRKGLDSEAETVLRDLLKCNPLLPLDQQSNANYLLAEVLDALGQYAGALTCLDKAKTLRYRLEDTARREQFYANMDRARRAALAELTPATLRRWREEASDSPCPHPLACLAGAPRSGTTLLEQILGAHPGILVVDEPPSFMKEVVDKILPPPQARLLTVKSLDDLTAAGRAQLIGRYFKNLLHETDENPGDRLLLDKNPLATVWLHVWLRLFPLSKVVMALRDPRDVIISCYFQNWPLSWATITCLNLERTARFYADRMDAWLRMRELGGFDWIETRYEDVVANVEGEGRRVTNFLGLPWHEAQATYYETAFRRFVHSPTYNEVTQPVHNRAVGRWKHYAGAVAPLQAGLEPYLRAFGYA
jgi:tetratricopeptide (TPR) repeat protein